MFIFGKQLSTHINTIFTQSLSYLVYFRLNKE